MPGGEYCSRRTESERDGRVRHGGRFFLWSANCHVETEDGGLLSSPKNRGVLGSEKRVPCCCIQKTVAAGITLMGCPYRDRAAEDP